MARKRRAEQRDHGDAALLIGSVELRRVRAVLALGGVPWPELEDAVQEVRVKLLAARERPDAAPIRNQGPWLAVVASRVAADWHRDRERDTGLRERLAARWADRPPVHPQADCDLALTVAEGLEQLTVLQRQAVVLRFYVDLPVGEIASLLEVAEGTVKSRLHSAVAALRSRMDDVEVI